MAFSLVSPALRDGAPIPETYVREGRNRSPPLRWSDPPNGTRSFLLIAEDTDAPDGVFRHWAMYNLDPSVRELPEGAGDGSAHLGRMGRNDFGRRAYDGPQPPSGASVSSAIKRKLRVPFGGSDQRKGGERFRPSRT